MKNVVILGSTGSIGTQTLEVIATNRDRFKVTALVAYSNYQLLLEQIKLFSPKVAILVNTSAAEKLRNLYAGPTKIYSGTDALDDVVTDTEVDIVLTAMVGFAGLKPTIAAIKAGKKIALANKETLVAAGRLVMDLTKQYNVSILPVDSEHSAIFQCLDGKEKQISKIILTASGGPFRTYTQEQLEKVSIESCLKHPNWSMGKKITVDSATLINKGLEVIEARWLFDVDYDQIEVVVHPQSIIHSMVEYIDGSILAQLGQPDMRLPIHYALCYPERTVSIARKMFWQDKLNLSFEKPNIDLFKGLKLAFQAGRMAKTMPCVLNAANEIAVEAFLAKQIKFLDIPNVVEQVMLKHDNLNYNSVEEIIIIDLWARKTAQEIIKSILK